MYLPIFLLWNLWKTRNNIIFENIDPNIPRLCNRICLETSTHLAPHPKNYRSRNIGPPPRTRFPVAFFDGVVVASLGGAGIVIWLNDHHLFSITLGCGPSTNTRVELLALWALLSVAKDFGLPYLYVFSDSLVIRNWVNGDSSLNMVNLDAWCYNTKMLLSAFTHVDISHVYREYNTRADTLSKARLMKDVGNLTLSEICDGEALEEVRMQLF